MVAKPNLEVAALARLERASPLFQPSLQLGAGHASMMQQNCCEVNRIVVLAGPANGPLAPSASCTGFSMPVDGL
jgi:hypothetical protein